MAVAKCFLNVDELGRELTVHGRADFPIGCYHDDLQREEVPWHWHVELEAAVVTEGETVLHVENRQVRLKAGDGFFINSGYLHACDHAGEGACRFHSMSFHARLIGGEENSVFWAKYMDPLLADPQLRFCELHRDTVWQRNVLDHIEQVWQACTREEPGFELTTRAMLSEVVFLLFEHAAKEKYTGGRTARTISAAESIRIKQMMTFMREHCSEPLSIARIADSAGISRTECLRVFRHSIEMSPIQYLKFLRIQKAAHLLTNTKRKIIDIGIECGFQDMSYFSKVFRQQKGCTPREYRRFSQREANQRTVP